jgi:hypothetical protein
MKKMLLMIACIVTVMCVNAQVKVLNNGNVGIGTTNPSQKLHVSGKLFLDRAGTMGGWNCSYLHWYGHHLVMGTPVGTNCHNILNLMPGGSTQEMLFSEFNMYTATAPNQQVLRVKINSSGNVYFINTGNFGIGTSNPAYKLHVYGSTYINGTAICRDGYWAGSDIALKSNILPIDNALSKVKNLEGKTYSLINVDSNDKGNNIQYGFIAQDVEKLIPELVRKEVDSLEFLAINYDGFIPILVEAVKEQQSIIEDLQQKAENRNDELLQKIKSLESALAACCNDKSQKSIQEFNLSNLENVSTEELKVYQNAPNPFTETTIINCYIPETIKKAELCIYDMSGSRLKCLTVTERGTTTIQIQAGQLAAGVYTYLLIGDGKNSDAKQMILTK